MAGGTVVGGQLETTSPLDTYPTHDSNTGRGGLHHVQIYEDLDGITAERRQHGMLVHVAENDEYYRLLNDLSTWQKFINANSSSFSHDITVTEGGEYVASPDDNTIFLEAGATLTVLSASILKGKEYTVIFMGINGTVYFNNCLLFGVNSPDGVAQYNNNSPYETLIIKSNGQGYINTMTFAILPESAANANALIGDAASLADTTASTRIGDQYSVTARFQVITKKNTDGGDDQVTLVYPHDLITRKTSDEWGVERGEAAMEKVASDTIANEIGNYQPTYFVKSNNVDVDGNPLGGLEFSDTSQCFDGQVIKVKNIGTQDAIIKPGLDHEVQDIDGVIKMANFMLPAQHAITWVYDKEADSFKVV